MTPNDRHAQRRRPSSFPLYILTDANGFVTCCEASYGAMMAEAGRVPLLAPITVAHWTVPPNQDQPEWALTGGFSWP